MDLGSYANILPKQTWEYMGKPTLQWSPIQLQMANQQNIVPMGRLQGIMVDIHGASTRMGFKVIEIVDENSSYPALLGIDWATDMNEVINLKKQKMIFEKKSLCIFVPLDLTKGPRYTELVHDKEGDNELDCIYKIATHRPQGDKPMDERRLSWGYANFSSAI